MLVYSYPRAKGHDENQKSSQLDCKDNQRNRDEEISSCFEKSHDLLSFTTKFIQTLDRILRLD